MRDQRGSGQNARHDRSGDPQLADVWPLDVRQVPPQQDERHHLQDVGDHGREHRHVEQRRHDLRTQLGFLEDEHEHCDGVADDRSGDQRHVRRLPLPVRDREERGKYPARDSEYVFRP